MRPRIGNMLSAKRNLISHYCSRVCVVALIALVALANSQNCAGQEMVADSLETTVDADSLDRSPQPLFGIPILQSASEPDPLRTAAVVGLGVAAGASEFARRKEDYRRLVGPFTVENDWSYARSADKFGHVFFTHYLSQTFATGFQWAGYERKKAAVMGAVSGFTGMLHYEILDGFGSNENFSPIDVAANAVGAGLFAGRTYVPALEHIHVKMSYWPSGSDCDYTCDYEGQTAWVTANPAGLAPQTPLGNLPPWLNLAIGYGARDGSVALGFEESVVYFGLDFEPAGLPIEGRLWDALVPWLQFVHFPAPALRLTPNFGFEPFAY